MNVNKEANGFKSRRMKRKKKEEEELEEVEGNEELTMKQITKGE